MTSMTRLLGPQNEDAVAHVAVATTPVSLPEEQAVARALAQCIVSAMADEECWQQLQSLLQLVLPSCRLAGYVTLARRRHELYIYSTIDCASTQATVSSQRRMLLGDLTR